MWDNYYIDISEHSQLATNYLMNSVANIATQRYEYSYQPVVFAFSCGIRCPEILL
jgi:hypothetical protein